MGVELLTNGHMSYWNSSRASDHAWSSFPEQALTYKHAKYNPLIENIRNQGLKTNPLITITTGVRGAIHEHSITKLSNLKIPKTSINTLMKNIHQKCH